MKHNYLFLVLAVSTASSALADENPGTATLPLDEVIRLHRSASTATTVQVPPPVPYTVSHFDVRARIISDAIEATATVKLTVFENAWTRVPLLKTNKALHITSLPAVDGGHFLALGGGLSFVSKQAGSYEFDVGFLLRASRKGVLREVSLTPSEAAIQRLELKHDEDLFEVTSVRARREGDTLIVFPEEGELRLAWKTLRVPTSPQEEKRNRPPIEPVVRSGYASIVVTLDGQRISRNRYNLRFQGQEPLRVSIPPGQQLTKIYLNGISRPIELKEGKAEIMVTPPRPGDQNAVVELVLKEDNPPMALSGDLTFKLPELSWNVNEMNCTLFLPKVFNYHWVGGSLSPGEADQTPSYTFDIPTPGKAISVKQQLVNGSADTVVAYTVDLTKNYFQ